MFLTRKDPEAYYMEFKNPMLNRRDALFCSFELSPVSGSAEWFIFLHTLSLFLPMYDSFFPYIIGTPSVIHSSLGFFILMIIS